ncbi:MAG: hypothetical protein ICV84_19550, partial [Flavisolibacter sp.]|nr:hypothetical protein [Flavisolibacter sp.]
MKRNLKTNVTVQPYPGRPNLLRIRWSYQGKRVPIYVPKEKPQLAEQIRSTIEADLKKGTYDPSLKRYKDILETTPEVKP